MREATAVAQGASPPFSATNFAIVLNHDTVAERYSTQYDEDSLT
jgi:hypothetical protein